MFCSEWCRILGVQTLAFPVPFTADGAEVRLVWSDGALSLVVNGARVSDEETAIAMFREMMR